MTRLRLASPASGIESVTDDSATSPVTAGFTLIELMVVIIIIGILAAVAIPAFLGQRNAAWDASARSDLANFTTFADQYAQANNGLYTGMSYAVLSNSHYGFVPSAGEPPADWTLTVTPSGGNYTAQVFNANFPSPATGHLFTYDSSTGRQTQS